MKASKEAALFWKMYVTLCGAADQAITLIDDGNVWGARSTLQNALLKAEELYINTLEEPEPLDTPPES